ncbi:MAG: hypothetical protein PHC60_08270 [Heliobacteriaceae bacterium]|nr:hypothetical protein [Heliobacteriaceae bacterium]MDD4588367.1 hypothetical protein [Heliobacteriaceae bacterium]
MTWDKSKKKLAVIGGAIVLVAIIFGLGFGLQPERYDPIKGQQTNRTDFLEAIVGPYDAKGKTTPVAVRNLTNQTVREVEIAVSGNRPGLEVESDWSGAEVIAKGDNRVISIKELPGKKEVVFQIRNVPKDYLLIHLYHAGEETKLWGK